MTEVKAVISGAADTGVGWTAALRAGWRIGALFAALNDSMFSGMAIVARPSS